MAWPTLAGLAMTTGLIGLYYGEKAISRSLKAAGSAKAGLIAAGCMLLAVSIAGMPTFVLGLTFETAAWIQRIEYAHDVYQTVHRTLDTLPIQDRDLVLQSTRQAVYNSLLHQITD